jgi:hypothetical protein
MRLKILSMLSLALVAACGKPPSPAAAPVTVAGHCTYVNPFSKSEECRDYLGEWPTEIAAKDCDDQTGVLVVGAACAYPAVLARCLLDGNDGPIRLAFPGADASTCASLKTGCEFFAGGTFVPEAGGCPKP